MPTFDVVSEVDLHEVTNALDQANREVSTRFDFKGTDSRFEMDDTVITMISQSDFQLQQMHEMLLSKLSKRGIDVGDRAQGKGDQHRIDAFIFKGNFLTRQVQPFDREGQPLDPLLAQPPPARGRFQCVKMRDLAMVVMGGVVSRPEADLQNAALRFRHDRLAFV